MIARSAPLVLLSLAVMQSVPSSLTAQVTVGANVHVSKAFGSAPHFELLANADPNDPMKMIACSYVHPKDRSQRATIVYSSFDGGKTWENTLAPSKLEDSGDPVCAFGPHGEAYYSMLKGDSTGSYTWLFRSADGGHTWGEGIKLAGTDRQSVIVDNTPTSKYFGSVYINATGTTTTMGAGLAQVFQYGAGDLTVFFSRDGVNFNTTKRAEVGKDYILGMGNGAVFTDGELIFVFGDMYNQDGMSEIPHPLPRQPNAKLLTVHSKDGGFTLDPPVKVSEWYMNWPPNASAVIPYVVVDHSNGPYKDRAYVVWPDRRSGRDEIYVSYSDDRGKTWSAPHAVNDDRAWTNRAGPDNVLPVIGVNKDGVVGVSWQDRRDNPDNLGYWTRFRASLDGGDTWAPSVRVSEKAHVIGQTEEWPMAGSGNGNGGKVTLSINYMSFGFSGGHYAGMAVSADGAFHPTWVDNRTGVPQIWTAPVSVAGTVIKGGATELSGMENVSDRLSVELTNMNFDRKTGKLSLSATLKNTSKDTIRGPIKVRVVEMRSDLADVKIDGATNGISAPGAILDFSSVLPSGTLLPSAKATAKTLTFTLSDLRPFRKRDEYEFNLGVLVVETRVFAASVTGKK